MAPAGSGEDDPWSYVARCDEATSLAMQEVLGEAYMLWCRKHESYGPHNISVFGIKGVFVRMWDKVQRLRRLVWLAMADPLKDETIEDTFLDLINYGAIAILLLRGLWPKSPYGSEEGDGE